MKQIKDEILGSEWEISQAMLDIRGDREKECYSKNEKRGGFPYNPPIDWFRIGLNVKGHYDNGNDDWLACDNRKGEWAVAYYGMGSGQEGERVKKIVGIILRSNFRPGSGQIACNDDDMNHPGSKVGKGVYFTPILETAKEYAGRIRIGKDNYSILIMVRCHPEKIRISRKCPDNWVLSGSSEDTRPYGLLFQKV